MKKKKRCEYGLILLCDIKVPGEKDRRAEGATKVAKMLKFEGLHSQKTLLSFLWVVINLTS
jgi:hypothetical protein